MDETRFTDSVAKLASEQSQALERLERRTERLRRTLRRAEDNIVRIRAEYRQRLTQLWEEHSGPGPATLPSESPSEVGQRKRIAKRSLDVPILNYIREHFPATPFELQDVVTGWNALEPAAPVGSTTLRGVVERLVSDRSLRHVEPGGVGSGRATAYELADPGGETTEELQAPNT